MSDAYRCDKCNNYADGEPSSIELTSASGVSNSINMQYDVCNKCLSEINQIFVQQTPSNDPQEQITEAQPQEAQPTPQPNTEPQQN